MTVDQRVYIATRDVRHIAAWIADAVQPDPDYKIGRYRPICGARAVVSWPVAARAPRLLFGSAVLPDARWTYPVCQRCAAEAAVIAAAAAS